MDKIDINTLIESYHKMDTSTIGHLTEVGYLPDIKALYPCAHTVVGKILTVSLNSDNTAVINQALIQAQPNDILCIDAQILGIKACWGALRTCAAIYEKLAGVIILGQVTDSLQIQQLGFPIFAKGLSSVTTYKSGQAQGILASDIRYSLDAQSTLICSGDIAIMDNDGIFVLPLDLAQQLLPDCQAKHQQDKIKFQLFFDAYKNDHLDLLLQNS